MTTRMVTSRKIFTLYMFGTQLLSVISSHRAAFEHGTFYDGFNFSSNQGKLSQKFYSPL